MVLWNLFVAVLLGVPQLLLQLLNDLFTGGTPGGL